MLQIVFQINSALIKFLFIKESWKIMYNGFHKNITVYKYCFLRVKSSY